MWNNSVLCYDETLIFEAIDYTRHPGIICNYHREAIINPDIPHKQYHIFFLLWANYSSTNDK